MKKTICILLSLFLIATAFCACSKTENTLFAVSAYKELLEAGKGEEAIAVYDLANDSISNDTYTEYSYKTCTEILNATREYFSSVANNIYADESIDVDSDTLDTDLYQYLADNYGTLFIADDIDKCFMKYLYKHYDYSDLSKCEYVEENHRFSDFYIVYGAVEGKVVYHDFFKEYNEESDYGSISLSGSIAGDLLYTDYTIRIENFLSDDVNYERARQIAAELD